jgi:acyl-CoA thioesterase-1
MPNRDRTLLRILIHAVAVVLLLTTAACESDRQPSPEEPVKSEPVADGRKVIVAMGDSLTAGLGVTPEESYPALLERLLADNGYDYRVINAGISGETSSGARSRVDWILRLKPAIVILETGANDGLRGIDPALVEENIEQMVIEFKRQGVTIVLAGMMMVTNLGEEYVAAFNRIYPQIARKHDLILMPFFLQDVAADPSKNQADGIHPNSDGYRIIASNLLPFVVQAIQRE